jgi:hypothetical protein
MKLTNRTIASLWLALHDLDGEKKIVDGQEVVEKRFEFKGNVLYAIARTINHLRGHQAVVQTTTDALVRSHSNGSGSISSTTPEFAAFQTELNAMLDQEVEVQLHQVTVGDLNLDKNHLRPATLAALEPIIAE